MGSPVRLRAAASTVGVNNSSERRNMWRAKRVTNENHSYSVEMQMPWQRLLKVVVIIGKSPSSQEIGRGSLGALM